ncbi:MAG: GGDEF domain-containing protein [Coriobacteriia bacterium]|nr:GGDEF domain-containing protein [Coriobacteriia bacterium]
MTDAERDYRHAHGPTALISPARGSASWVSGVVSTPITIRVVLSLVLLAFVGLVDTAIEISFSVFYLIPVLFAGTFLSRGAGRAMAVVSAATWGYLELLGGGVYSSAWIPVWNSAVRLAFFLIINELVHAMRQAHARERELSRKDSLTGIANGRVFAERVDQVIAQARRDGRPFTITYVDLDRFKEVNDTEGHSEGDRLFKAVATAIERDLRATDVVARLGGDEFGILMTECGVTQARQSLERIAASLALELGKRWGVGATFGAVTFDTPPDDVDSAVRLADDLMYRGKAEGRGRIMQATWPGLHAAETELMGCPITASSRQPLRGCS